MNIFVLDNDPLKAAQYHADKHVVKMILESAQILSTIHHTYQSQILSEVYKATHQNHPWVKWAGKAKDNYIWLYTLYSALCSEYTYRYCKIHASSKLLTALSRPPATVPDISLTAHAQAMPLQYRSLDAVAAYRSYYKHEKKHLLKYTKQNFPDWLN